MTWLTLYQKADEIGMCFIVLGQQLLTSHGNVSDQYNVQYSKIHGELMMIFGNYISQIFCVKLVHEKLVFKSLESYFS